MSGVRGEGRRVIRVMATGGRAVSRLSPGGVAVGESLGRGDIGAVAASSRCR